LQNVCWSFWPSRCWFWSVGSVFASQTRREREGIGEPFTLKKPEKSERLNTPETPLTVSFTVLEEKFVGRTLHAGWLVGVSASEAELWCEFALSVLGNLKMDLLETAGSHPGGEIYAKVVKTPAKDQGPSLIRFTSVSPDLKEWILRTGG
jgi:hypothetical protein